LELPSIEVCNVSSTIVVVDPNSLEIVANVTNRLYAGIFTFIGDIFIVLSGEFPDWEKNNTLWRLDPFPSLKQYSYTPTQIGGWLAPYVPGTLSTNKKSIYYFSDTGDGREKVMKFDTATLTLQSQFETLNNDFNTTNCKECRFTLDANTMVPCYQGNNQFLISGPLFAKGDFSSYNYGLTWGN